MKKIIITILLPLSALTVRAQVAKKSVPAKKTTTTAKKTPAKPAAVAFKSTLDSASYSLGINMASNMKGQGLTSLNYDLLAKGLKDAFEGKTSLIPEAKSKTAVENLFRSVNEKKFAAQIAEGRTFLANNKTQAGIQVTPSGLQYQVITPGTGIKPLATDTVLVHYRGTLLNGKEFDSSYSRNEPISFPLDRVIKGWTEGLQLMPAGSKYKFFIPQNLAYGERGAGNDITPYSTLIFEVELLKVNRKQ